MSTFPCPVQANAQLDSTRSGLPSYKLNAYIDGLPPPGEAGPAQEVDEETRDALRNLGYVK